MTAAPPAPAAAIAAEDKRARLARLMREKRAAETGEAAPGLWRRFAAAVAAAPDREAVDDGRAPLTAQALERSATDLAARLSASGVGPGDRVAVVIGTGPDVAPDVCAALLAVARIGAVSVPVEADDGPVRRERIMATARPAAVIVTAGAEPSRCDDAVPSLTVTVPGETAAAPPVADGATFAMVFPEDTAECIPTQALNRQLAGAASVLSLPAGDRVVFASSLHDGVTSVGLLWPLCSPATLTVARPDADALGAVLDKSPADVLVLRPALLDALIAERGASGLPGRVLVSGEPSAAAVVALAEAGVALKAATCLPRCAGPALVAEARKDADLGLGRPAGGQVQVVDRHGVAVPPGVPGMLEVDGTATGMRVRRRRSDQQIERVGWTGRRRSVDGFAVDPAAIEEAAREVPGVADAAALIREETPGLAVVALYAVPSGRSLPPDFAKTLGDRLAPWMRPAAIVPVGTIPLDATGEIDEVALARLPVIDEAVRRRWETALAGTATDAAVVLAPVEAEPRTLSLPAPILRERRVGTAEPGPPLGADRPAHAVGDRLVIPPDAPRTLTEALLRTAHERPERGLWLVDGQGGETRLTYAALLAESRRIAGGLVASGLAPGDTVILQLQGHRRYFPAFWGAVLAGLRPVTVAVSPDYGEPSGTVLKLVNAWRLLGEPPIVAPHAMAADVAALSAHTGGTAPRVLAMEELAEAPAVDPHPARPEDVLFLQLSSGSTGVPKVIQVTHRGVVAHVHGDIAACGDHAGDVDVNWLPLDHVVPLLTCHLKDTYLGCEQVEVPTADVIADPLLWLRVVERYRATRTWAPNFGFKLVATALAADPDAKFDLSSVRHFMNAGEQVTLPVMTEFLDRIAPFGAGPQTMQPAFGMAEACTCMTYENGYAGEASLLRVAKSSLDGILRVPGPDEAGATTFVRLGRPVPGVEVRIAGADGATLREGVIGRMQIRGDVVTPGYVANRAANDEAFVGDGWFNSGDLGVIVDGNLALTGREKETIIVNGANFYCYEIEDVVNAAPGVEPTFAAAVASPADETGSEGLAVFFVPLAGEDGATVARAVRGAVVSRLGINPRHVVPLEREAFPKTTSGKIQRMALKARLAELAPEASGEMVPAWFYRETWVPRAARSPEATRRSLLIIGAPPAEALASAWTAAGAGDARFAGPDASRSTLPSDADAVVVLVLGEPERSGLDAITAALARLADLGRSVTEWAEPVLADGASPADGPRPAEGARPAVGAGRRRVVVVTRAAFAAEDTVPHPAAAALRPAIRSLAQETPDLALQLVDLGAGISGEAELAALVEELRGTGADDEVALRDGRRLVPRLQAVDVPRARVSSLVRGGRYLVTGGLGSLGQALCRILVERCDADVVVLGRRLAGDVAPLSEGSGGRVTYVQADVSDGTRLAAAVAEAETGGPFDGVFHLAGVAEARSMREETSETLREALAAKVGGALNLAAAFAARPDVAVVHFGSVNAVFGGADAGAYAAANAALEAITRQRRAAGGQGFVVHWSQWAGSGMAARFGLGEFAAARGFMPIETDAGLASLLALTAGDEPAVMVGLDGANPNVRPNVAAPVAALTELRAFVAGGGGRPEAIGDRFGTDVPSRLVAVDALPRTADGSLDLVALEGATGRELGADDGAPRTATEQRVAAIWQDLLGRGTVGRGEDFFAVGGHSLVAARLMLRIRQEFGRDMPLRALFGAPTVAGMSAAIDAASEAAVLPDCLVALQPDGREAPIFCVHPAGGSPLCYLPLAGHLGAGQPFYGFQAPGLAGGHERLENVEAMAAHYLAAARAVIGDRPIRLAAWSSGGPVAFEMARQVEAAGGRVDLLAMFDCGLLESDNPVRGWGPVRSVRALRMIGRYLSQIHRPRSWDELAGLARLIGLVLPPRWTDVRWRDVADLTRAMRLFNHNTTAAIRYRPGDYGGHVALFRATGSRPREGDDPVAADLTRYAAGGVDVIEVPGTHMSIILDPKGAAALARRLEDVLTRAPHSPPRADGPKAAPLSNDGKDP